ncbi:hypothetical protein, partial [Yoonia sp.]|uniref:hypothetical protein n=1 Tax=Yoonia sp. TaxID=2212373 RepID=UPI003975AE77
MPFDQSFETAPAPVPAKPPRAVHLLLAGAVFAALAIISPLGLLQYGFAVFGGILMCLAAFLKIADLNAGRVNSRLCQNAR